MFFRILSLRWKFFRQTVDLSAVFGFLRKSCICPFIGIDVGRCVSGVTGKVNFVRRVLLPLIPLVIWPDMMTGISSERKELCRQIHG